jgi:hypothetical protein
MRKTMIAPQATDTRHWRFHTDLEKIGWLVINTPEASVNTLSREAIMELETLVARFEDLANSGELVGVVILSGKDSGFIAGADVSEFDAMSDFSVLPEALRRTHALFARIEALSVPVDWSWRWPAIIALPSTTKKPASAFRRSIWAFSPVLAEPAGRSAKPGRSMPWVSC